MNVLSLANQDQLPKLPVSLPLSRLGQNLDPALAAKPFNEFIENAKAFADPENDEFMEDESIQDDRTQAPEAKKQ